MLALFGRKLTIFCIFITGIASDVKFKFNHLGDGPARYNIMHYKQISKGHFEWINVGEFHDGEMELRMEGM